MKKTNLTDLCANILILSAYSIVPLIVLGLAVVIITNFFLGGITTDINKTDGLLQMFVGYSLPMIFVLVIIPFLFEVKIRKHSLFDLGLVFKKNKISIIVMAVLTLLSFLISIYFVGINDSEGIAIIVSFIVVALTEEFYSRGVLYSEIERMWGRQTAVLLSSFIFAFLFHSNSEFVVNLLFRLPIALLLGILRKKTNSIYIGSAVHYIYNIIVNL